MAYSFASASSQYLSAGSAVITAISPSTFSAFAKSITASTTRTIFYNGSSTTGTQVYLRFNTDGTISGAVIASTTGAAVATGAVSSDIWSHAAVNFVSGTERNSYRDGGNKGTNTTSVTGPNWDQFWISGRRNATQYFNGEVAETAVWAVALSDDEIASLAKGFKPTRIRPQSLVFYAPLIRNIQDLKAGLALTNNNTATVADHPRVY